MKREKLTKAQAELLQEVHDNGGKLRTHSRYITAKKLVEKGYCTAESEGFGGIILRPVDADQ